MNVRICAWWYATEGRACSRITLTDVGYDRHYLRKHGTPITDAPVRYSAPQIRWIGFRKILDKLGLRK